MDDQALTGALLDPAHHADSREGRREGYLGPCHPLQQAEPRSREDTWADPCSREGEKVTCQVTLHVDTTRRHYINLEKRL